MVLGPREKSSLLKALGLFVPVPVPTVGAVVAGSRALCSWALGPECTVREMSLHPSGNLRRRAYCPFLGAPMALVHPLPGEEPATETAPRGALGGGLGLSRTAERSLQGRASTAALGSWTARFRPAGCGYFLCFGRKGGHVWGPSLALLHPLGSPLRPHRPRQRPPLGASQRSCGSGSGRHVRGVGGLTVGLGVP